MSSRITNATCGLTGSTCVITGATSGIGRAAARALARTGMNLVLVARREQLGAQICSALRQIRGAGRIDFIPADLSDQAQVRSLAEAITAKYRRLEVLINNAGARFNHFQTGRDEMELTFATNHLGHFLLTHLLLEVLQEAKSARVITVSSSAHVGVDAKEPWYLGPQNYDRKLAYSKSKLANLMFALELARRLKSTRVVSNALDPGGVATHLGKNNGLLSWCRHLAYYALKRELLTPRQGASPIVSLATDPSLETVTGKYFQRYRVSEPSSAALDREAAACLWSLSRQLAHVDETADIGSSVLVPETPR